MIRSKSSDNSRSSFNRVIIVLSMFSFVTFDCGKQTVRVIRMESTRGDIWTTIYMSIFPRALKTDNSEKNNYGSYVRILLRSDSIRAGRAWHREKSSIVKTALENGPLKKGPLR